jgi:hypothetical protein
VVEIRSISQKFVLGAKVYWNDFGIFDDYGIYPHTKARTFTMSAFESSGHGLHGLFAEVVHDAFISSLGQSDEEIEIYLAGLLNRFIHTDQIFSIKDARGRPIVSITEMLSEGDVLLNANSFEREREVHRHIGDFILFWSGIFPDFLTKMRFSIAGDMIVNLPKQAQESYHVVSLFELPPHDTEAPKFRKLSSHFTEYQYALQQVRATLDLPRLN